MIPVVLGILIALFINSWNEERKDQNYLKGIFASMKQELQESKAEIIKNIPKQQRFIDSLSLYLNDDTVSIIEVSRKADGLHAPLIRTNSWAAISQTKIELVDYDKLKVLTDIEESKEIFKEKLKFLMNFAFSNMRDTSRAKKEVIIFMLSDIISTEKSMHQTIEEFEKFDSL